MKNLIRALFALVFFSAVLAPVVTHAQAGATAINFLLHPQQPNSADNISLSMIRSCGIFAPYIGPPFLVSMQSNQITVRMGNVNFPLIVPLCASTIEEVPLARLPAGDYTVTVIGPPNANTPNAVLLDRKPFSVSDARLRKAAPYTRLDTSGHWWDPNDSGWGLFIWQNAASPVDSMLVAWFTYKPDGTPMWYVFQPEWETSTTTKTASLVNGLKPPGPTSPPPGPLTVSAPVGTAKLDFTMVGDAVDTAVLTYSFNGGPELTRTIKRFKP